MKSAKRRPKPSFQLLRRRGGAESRMLADLQRVQAGHRLRLEIGNADSIIASQDKPHDDRNKVTNTIYEGGRKPSRLIVPSSRA